jgi:hypothetical protein
MLQVTHENFFLQHKYVFVAFDTNCSKDVNDTRGASGLLYFKREETGAFFNNSWRISPGGQWRIAAATCS